MIVNITNIYDSYVIYRRVTQYCVVKDFKVNSVWSKMLNIRTKEIGLSYNR